MNIAQYDTRDRYPAVVRATTRITPDDTAEVRHIVLGLDSPRFSYTVGQSIGVLRLYSIAGAQPATRIRRRARQLGAEPRSQPHSDRRLRAPLAIRQGSDDRRGAMGGIAVRVAWGGPLRHPYPGFETSAAVMSGRSAGPCQRPWRKAHCALAGSA
jgi:hypothetical protein